MANKITYEVDVKTGKSVRNVEKLNESVKETGKETEKVQADFSELGGTLDNVTGGAITKFKGFTGAIKNVSKGFKGLRAAIISTGIGALVIAVTSLTAAFTSSEEGQNKFEKILKQVGVIAGNVTDIFSSFGKMLISVFVDRDLKAAGKAFDEFTNRVSNFGKETQKEIELAGQLADKIAEANKKERELLIERAKTNVEINKLKTKAAEVDKFTSEQRIQFLEQAAALEDEITGKEVDLAETRLQIKQQENSLSESTREDLEEEARLEEQLIRLQEGRLVRNKELLGVAAGLRKAEADKRLAERNAEIAQFAKDQETISSIIQKEAQKQTDIELAKNEGIKTMSADALQSSLLNKKAETDAVIRKNEEEKFIEENKNRFLAEGVMATSQLIQQIAGEDSKVGKAAAIAQATISGVQGTINAFKTAQDSPITTVFPPYPFIQAGIAAAFAVKNIQTIKSTDPSGRGGATMTGGRGQGTAQSQVPSVNVVGASGINQVAQAIGQNEQKPIKAFVVADDVTSQQALDRKVTEKASIG